MRIDKPRVQPLTDEELDEETREKQRVAMQALREGRTHARAGDQEAALAMFDTGLESMPTHPSL